MRQNNLFTTIILAIITLNAFAQSKQNLDANPLAEISRVSNLVNLLESQEGLVYRVQFLTSKEPLAKDDIRLKNLSNVYHYQDSGLIKYTWGMTRLPLEASRLKRELHRNGFKDAFVVYFYNGKRISQKEAMTL